MHLIRTCYRRFGPFYGLKINMRQTCDKFNATFGHRRPVRNALCRRPTAVSAIAQGHANFLCVAVLLNAHSIFCLFVPYAHFPCCILMYFTEEVCFGFIRYFHLYFVLWYCELQKLHLSHTQTHTFLTLKPRPLRNEVGSLLAPFFASICCVREIRTYK